MNVDQLETPAVVVDADVLEANIHRMAAYASEHGIALRPHTKTHKIPEIARMQVQAGARGVTVAKTGEAEVMARAGIEDILIAYPIFGESKWQRIARLASERRITVSLDSEQVAAGLSRAAQQVGSTVGVLVEFDVGMHRCGLQSPADVVRLAATISAMPGLEFRGVLYYPGHIWAQPSDQAAPLRDVGALVAEVLDSLQRAGLNAAIVSGGSTPTARNSHLVGSTTEIRAGTYVFNDRNTFGVGACGLEDCALRVIVTVVSTAVPGRAIVDAGTKTLTSDRWLSGSGDGFGHVVDHPDVRVIGLSEEHGHLDISSATGDFRVGDRLAIIPNHVCACVNLHNELHYARRGVIEGKWTVAGRGLVR